MHIWAFKTSACLHGPSIVSDLSFEVEFIITNIYHNQFSLFFWPVCYIVADVKSRLQSMGSKISDKLDLDPETFLPAVESMLEQFEAIKTDGHLQSALHSFGMCTDTCMALKKRQRRLLPAGLLLPAGTSHILVQPTEIVDTMSSSLLPDPKRKKGSTP